jgi:hypothetical protein
VELLFNAEETSRRRSTKLPVVASKTITFDEVFQNGKAQYKHIIVEFPQGQNSNMWYILRCDEHHVHFGLSPLLGAAKHLHSAQHGNQPKAHKLAIETVGFQVIDCTREMAKMNNDVATRAFEEGYVPFNVNRLSRAEKIEQGFLTPDESSKRKKRVSNAAAGQEEKLKPFPGLTSPVPGELYLGLWNKNKTKYPVMMFPMTGSIGITGLPGTLASIGLLGTAPRCVRVNRRTQRVDGWAKGYEDGGPLTYKREFPVLYFDKKHQVGWLPAKAISKFDFEARKTDKIPEFDDARQHYARCKGFQSYEELVHERGPPPYSDVNSKIPVNRESGSC